MYSSDTEFNDALYALMERTEQEHRLKTASVKEAELSDIKHKLLIARYCPSLVGIEDRLAALERDVKIKTAKTSKQDNNYLAWSVGS